MGWRKAHGWVRWCFDGEPNNPGGIEAQYFTLHHLLLVSQMKLERRIKCIWSTTPDGLGLGGAGSGGCVLIMIMVGVDTDSRRDYLMG